MKPVAVRHMPECAAAASEHPFWRDGFFWLAVAAGPAFWVGLALCTSTLALGPGPRTEPQRLLLLALMYPIVEELAFRGGLQPLLGDLFRRVRWPGPLTLPNLLTSVAFSALHLVSHPAGWAASVFFPSLVFGYFRDRHGGLASPIMLHCVYNSGYFWWFDA